MIYALLPRGDLGWDDIRLFRSFALVEPLVTQGFYVIAFDGADELTPVWVFQLERGVLRRYPVNR
jgi:hypothetical protein